MKKNLVIGALTLTLALSAVSCGENKEDNLQENEAIENADSENKDTENVDNKTENVDNEINKNNEVVEGTNTTEDVEMLAEIEGLNTTIVDIKALDFYSTELSEDELSIQPFNNMVTDVEFTQLDQPVSGDLVAVIKTNNGIIKVKFLPEIAPKAVKNFVQHSLNDYYDGIVFHRIIDQFMIQGGDPTATGTGGESIWGKSFVNELSVNARHFSGTLAMANTGNNVSNGSQFYIVDDITLEEELIGELDYFAENQDEILDEEAGLVIGDMFSTEIINGYKEIGGAPYLDFGYTVFGQTYEGLEVVDAISQKAKDANDKPLEEVVIEDIIIGIVK